MLSTTVVHRCPHCQGEQIYRNGHTVRGAQRAKCKDCQRTFTLFPKGPRHSPALKAQVLAAHGDRMSLRGIHRTFGVCYQTVMKWVGEKNGAMPNFTDTLLPAERGDVLELDELWSFVQSKAQTLWLWVALCRRTRQVVAWTLGDRSLQSASDLRASLPPGYRRCASRSDLWEAYRAAFPARTHRCCPKPSGQTSHVERFFGTLRARLSRLVRKAYSFSKDPENHLDAIALFISNYNLQIQRQATPN